MRRGGLSGVGSSPHPRGAPAAGAPLRTTPRIIPAYAGSTTRSWPPAGRVADHPRIRGEHEAHPRWRCAGHGSSPHTRGAQGRHRRSTSRARIIPAYAGSTFSHRKLLSIHRDHPRIRGEHVRLGFTRNVFFGSSPHTRGALRRSENSSCSSWIIPAYAGSTPLRRRAGYRSRDHPRIRGEHGPVRRPRTACPGSSPHTRGARHRHPGSPRRERIIPAYAGSTSSIASPTRSARDHPRIRGEHSSTGFVMKSPTGSSPHTRGAQRRMGIPKSLIRIIPAYAGSTAGSFFWRRTWSDHPRIRGEHALGREPGES